MGLALFSLEGAWSGGHKESELDNDAHPPVADGPSGPSGLATHLAKLPHISPLMGCWGPHPDL